MDVGGQAVQERAWVVGEVALDLRVKALKHWGPRGRIMEHMRVLAVCSGSLSLAALWGFAWVTDPEGMGRGRGRCMSRAIINSLLRDDWPDADMSMY